jgi:MinD superfamily P-loop ATPase
MNDEFYELVVLSGKGGTGKTSVTAALAALAEQSVLADCDVDASNLPLLLDPQLRRQESFTGGLRAVIDPDECLACGKCMVLCRFGAISDDGPANGFAPSTFRVEPSACEGCGVCHDHCPAHAIALLPAENGEWFVSDTRFGPLLHARLQPGRGNSGKLVALVCDQARRIAREVGCRLILIDGPPGIACPVIACLNGAKRVLVITEPTPSGEHDLERVLALARHFWIPVWVCVNKYDLNPAATARLEIHAAGLGAEVVGRIPYDPAMTAAQRRGRTILECDPGNPAAVAITKLWERIKPDLMVNGAPRHANKEPQQT